MQNDLVERLEHEANCRLLEVLRLDLASQEPWKRGLPKGAYYPDMSSDFEIVFTPLAKWHRRRPHAAEAKRLYAEAADLRARATLSRLEPQIEGEGLRG